MLKIPLNAIGRINYVAKKKNYIKGLKFGDRQNIIDQLIITGVEYDPISDDNQGSGHADEIMQYDSFIEDELIKYDPNTDTIADDQNIDDDENMSEDTNGRHSNENDDVLVDKDYSNSNEDVPVSVDK